MSINIEHKDIPVGEIHSPFQWEVLNVAELSTIVPEGVNDVRKVAFVVDDGTGNPTAYVLTQFIPSIVWKPLVSVIGGGGSGAGGGSGSDGKSAYQIWLEAGNSGTVSDFLTSLIEAILLTFSSLNSR